MKVQKFNISNSNKLYMNENLSDKLILSEGVDDDIFTMMNKFDDIYEETSDEGGLHPKLSMPVIQAQTALDDNVSIPGESNLDIIYDDEFVDGEGMPSTLVKKGESGVAPEGPKTIPETGLAASLMHAINGEYNTITEYNEIIIFLKSLGRDDLIKVINDINAEEQKHVGQLQEILNTISDSAKEVAKGADEAKEQLEENSLNLSKEDTELLANLTLPEMRAETVAGIVAKLPDEIIPTLLDSVKEELKDIIISEETQAQIEAACEIDCFNNIPEFIGALINKDILTARTGLILLLQNIDETNKADNLLKASLVAFNKINTNNEVKDDKNILNAEVSNESN